MDCNKMTPEEFELELSRVWEIAEKHRLESEKYKLKTKKITSSISYRLLFPFRLHSIIYSNIEVYIKDLYFKYLKRTQSVNNGSSINALAKNRNLAIDFLSKIRVSKLDLSGLPNITISIVLYNNGNWLRGFFESLKFQKYPLDKIDLIFVDNKSTDDTLEVLQKNIDEVDGMFGSTLVINNKNNGFGSGHDRAFRKSKNEFVLVTNVDLEFLPDSLVSLVNYACLDSEDVAAWEARQKPYEHPKYYDPITHEVTWNSHACVLIRKKAYESIGGYEDKIFMYGEDVEISYSFRRYGWKLKYVAHAEVMHYTYAEANEFKLIQFTGSTYANALIRAKHGSKDDMMAGIMQFIREIKSSEGDRKLHLKESFKKFLIKAPWIKSFFRKKSFGPFRGWDYEMQRDGAFYELDKSLPITKQPLVSVIVRTYGGRPAEMLKQALASIVGQTYSNIEILVCEDGGAVHEELIEGVQQGVKGSIDLKYYSLPKKGRSFSGNFGLEKSVGKYCVFLDDDDLFYPDHIETLVSELKKDDKLSAVYALSWEVLTEYNLTPEMYLEKEHRTPQSFRELFSFERLKEMNYMPIQSILFDRALYEKEGGFLEGEDYLEDWNLWVRYAAIGNFKLIDKTTSIFRTPFDEVEREKRALLLNGAYEHVKSLNNLMATSK